MDHIIGHLTAAKCSHYCVSDNSICHFNNETSKLLSLAYFSSHSYLQWIKAELKMQQK